MKLIETVLPFNYIMIINVFYENYLRKFNCKQALTSRATD